MSWTNMTRIAASIGAALTLAAPVMAESHRDTTGRHAGAETLVQELRGDDNRNRNRNRERDRARNRDRRDSHDDDYRDRDWSDRGRRGRGDIVLFEHPGFRGSRYALNGDLDNLRGTGFNDRVSSIRVRSGTWLICEDPGFRGRCRILRNDRSAFNRHGFNDRISSIRRISEREARRYVDRGRGVYGDNGRGYDRGDYGRYGDYGGYGHDRGYGNNRRNTRYSQRDYNRADAIVFVDPNGRGRSMPINGSISNLAYFGFNDTISSINIRSGRWEVCSDPNFRGRCRIVDRTIGYTRDIGLNDNITSIRQVGGGRNRNRH